MDLRNAVTEGLKSQIGKALSVCAIDEIDTSKKQCYSLFQNGLFKTVRLSFGVFTYQLCVANIPNLDNTCEEGFDLILPFIPYSILFGIIDFFKDINSRFNNSEVMVQLWFDIDKDEYFTYVPVQKVSSVSIVFEHSKDMQLDDNLIYVGDIHSHNTMNAYFSKTDNDDEKSAHIFGVIGKINDNFPEIQFRIGSEGKYLELDHDDIFTLASFGDESDDIDVQEALKNIEYCKMATVHNLYMDYDQDYEEFQHRYFSHEYLYSNPDDNVPTGMFRDDSYDRFHYEQALDFDNDLLDNIVATPEKDIKINYGDE